MVSRTSEAKFALLDTGSQDWGSTVNAMLEALDAGAELTLVFGETVTGGECVALSTSDGLMYKAQSSSETLTPAIGFAPNAVTVAYKGKVRGFGWIDVDTSFSYTDSVSWSPGQAVYVGSVAGRLAKTRYSWANALGYAKSYTDSDWTTRIVIDPQTRRSELVEDLTVNKRLVFVSEYNNGNSGAAKAIDWQNGNHQKLVLSANCVLSFGHPFGIADVILKLQQDVTGSRLVTWQGDVNWPGGTAPTLTTTGNAVDICKFYWDGLNWHGRSDLDSK